MHESIRLLQLQLLVYDFDGVMTDNRVLVMQDGTEAVFVNRADGWGVAQLRRAGFRQLILSTETNLVVSARAKKLQIEAIQGSQDKAVDLALYCQNQKINLKSVLYIGNDLNDLEVMQTVGFTVAPRDSHPNILKIANHITNALGGHGVVREVAELLLKKET